MLWPGGALGSTRRRTRTRVAGLKATIGESQIFRRSRMPNRPGNDDRDMGVGSDNGQSASQNGGGQGRSRSNRGFASMDRSKQKEIASKGGKAAHAKGTAHEFTSEEAREAGRKGGMASHRRRSELTGSQSSSAAGDNTQNIDASDTSERDDEGSEQ